MAYVIKPRRIIDRKALTQRLDDLVDEHGRGSSKLRAAVLAELKEALAAGEAEIRGRFDRREANGCETMRANAHLIDQILRVLFDLATGRLYRSSNPSAGEKLSLVAVGGYGRGQLAPHSDVDILFLFPYKQTAWGEQVVEYLLYMLWDLRLKVGHATRSVAECLRLSQGDITIRTSILEARFVWGDRNLFDELRTSFANDVVSGSGPEYVEAKLNERADRHKRMGESRYLVEPNIKDGKGGLRDLHTLYWIAKYLYRVDDIGELIETGVLRSQEYRRFTKAENFLSEVRCHLHYLAGRAEERLTFDVQPEMAQRLRYTDHAGSTGVERFMKHYYLVAKDVGDLTRIFCADLEARHRRRSRFRMPLFGLRRREIGGFIVDGDRLDTAEDGQLNADPIKILELFRLAQEHGYDIHPNALRRVRRNLRLIGPDLRGDPQANQLFLDMLTSRADPETTLRRLNEAGVFGRFVPEFGRVVAQVQHDMYHHYTVDEHTIRAIGILSRIEGGELTEDHPLATGLMPNVLSRRALYVAVLLHDIAKGRPGDHSELGAEIVKSLCPRFGLTAAETETIAWLVLHHLAMSRTAFKRDLTDPKTVVDFATLVQSPERLKLLLILTVVDIRAVGPGVWNGWKGQLLRDLYNATEEALSGGLATAGRETRVARTKNDLRELLNNWPAEDVERHLNRGYDSYWLSNDAETLERHARMMREADRDDALLTMKTRIDRSRSVTEVTIYAADHPGLFARLCGAMAVSGATIVSAKISTTTDGMALDCFLIQSADGGPFDRSDRLARLSTAVNQALAGDINLQDKLATARSMLPSRADVFTVEPVVLIDNAASNTHTVIEINGRDRPGLLHALTWRLFRLSLNIASAHVATYGNRAVDVFYVKDQFGLKITNAAKLKAVTKGLMSALEQPEDTSASQAEEPATAVMAAMPPGSS